jgi:hypothetical protein
MNIPEGFRGQDWGRGCKRAAQERDVRAVQAEGMAEDRLRETSLPVQDTQRFESYLHGVRR